MSLVDRHELVDHRVVIGETQRFVTTHRIFWRVQEAAIAISARPRRQIVAEYPEPRQIRVGDEGAGDRDPIASTTTDRLADSGRALPSAGRDNRYLYRRLDRASFVDADAFYGFTSLHPKPRPVEQRSQQRVT